MIRSRLPRPLERALRSIRDGLPPPLRRRFASDSRIQLWQDRLRWGGLGTYIWMSRQVPGWTRGEEALALAAVARSLRTGAVIVEIGAFLGGGTILLAGARKLRGGGHVHVVDPFDASGDSHSVPVYKAIEGESPLGLRQRFDDNIRRAGLSGWVTVHQGRDAEVAVTWTAPIDLLFLDGDQSYRGARRAFDAWSPFLSVDGIIAVHNSRSNVQYAQDHDGLHRLVVEQVHAPQFVDVHCVGSTTFGRKRATVVA